MKKKFNLLILLIVLSSIMWNSCNMDPIEPEQPSINLNYPDEYNTYVVDEIRIGVYNLSERYYDISFILEGKDDTRERNIVYQDTFLYNVDMMNKESGGQSSFMITIKDIEQFGIVHVSLLNTKVEEFIPK